MALTSEQDFLGRVAAAAAALHGQAVKEHRLREARFWCQLAGVPFTEDESADTLYERLRAKVAPKESE